MELRTSFDLLSEVIASYEAAWGDVLHVETSTGSDSTTLQGSIELPLRYCGVGDDGDGRGLTPDDVEFRDDGGLSLSFAPEDLGDRDPSTPAGVSTTWADARVDDEAGIVVSVRFAIRPLEDAAEPAKRTVENAARAAEPVAAVDSPVEAPDSGTGDEPLQNGSGDEPLRNGSGDESLRNGSGDESLRNGSGDESLRNGSGNGRLRKPTADADGRDGSGDDAGADPLAEIRDEDVPPFDDRPYLEELYESCDNFGEMSERIEMDVSAETVRRYMIEAGVHTPDTYDTREEERAGGEENRSEAGATDGEDDVASVPDVDIDSDRFGLPRDMTIEETIDAVVDSRSLHEVTRHLDIDHDQARDLLRELDLLDFVSHRLVDAPEAEPTYEEVASRIRRSSPQTV